MNSNLTVIMSVYKNTIISEFEDSVLSVINQTLPPSQAPLPNVNFDIDF